MKKLSLALFILFASATAFAQTTIDIKDAPKHIGENVTICSKVFGGKYLDQSAITFLNVGGNYPDALLSLVIKGDDRKKFKESPEDAFKDKNICVTGVLLEYKGKPEIVITDTTQIKLNSK